jgi:hypothetical protein
MNVRKIPSHCFSTLTVMYGFDTTCLYFGSLYNRSRASFLQTNREKDKHVV